MKNTTPLLPGLHLPTLRRTPRSPQQKWADEVLKLKHKTFSQLGECFGKFIPTQYLLPSDSGTQSRRRFFSKENTFWAFFSQVIDADGGCKEVVRKLQAFAALKSKPLPSSSTSAYCQARKNLDISSLRSIFEHTANRIDTVTDTAGLNGRRVIVADGTGVSMPDTIENQGLWPQQRHQKEGCGFPQASICACFCLQTGTLLSYEIGNKKSHELPMLRQQWNTFNSGDIFLGDKGFCSFYDMFSFHSRGIDSVVTLARRKPITGAASNKILGDDDLLIHWEKPTRQKHSSYSKEDWAGLPETLPLRQIKVTVNQPGFRVSSFYIVTTLLDAEKYPASDIAGLYYKRWEVELNFADIKTTLGMDILRCKKPEMVRKEILMHFIVYNCIRNLVVDTVVGKEINANRISFKGCVQAVRQWEPSLNQTKLSKSEVSRLIELLYDSIATNIVPDRPGRREPRAVKRRPKPYQLLNKPRREMKEIKHRGKKYGKEA